MYAIDRSTRKEIIGTLETLSGRSEIDTDSFTRDKNGVTLKYQHGGYTEIFWDECRTVTEGGHTVFLTQDGDQVLECNIDLVDEPTDQTPKERMVFLYSLMRQDGNPDKIDRFVSVLLSSLDEKTLSQMCETMTDEDGGLK